MKVLLVTLIFPMLIFSQRKAMTYADANPGILKVYLDVRNDSLHLVSLIGKFDRSDVLKLKNFLSNPNCLKCGDSLQDSRIIGFVEARDILSNLLGREIDLCHIVASDTSYIHNDSEVGKEILLPLIVWAKKCDFICQMVKDVRH